MQESVATLIDAHNERQLTPGLPVVFILGATATGKSSLALHIARRLGGEIISCDSRYFYRGMNVGTAKPSAEEVSQAEHHLIDILDPEDDYSLATYLNDAYAAIEDVGSRGSLPIVAGGTPLYLRALLEGWTVPQAPPDQELRARLEEQEPETIYALVKAVDPVSAERIGEHNKRRLIRAYEVFTVTGLPLSDLEGKQPPPYRMLRLGLRQDRETLYQRIDERVRWMFANGLLEEASRLIERGVPEQAAAMSAIGYAEARAVVLGTMSLQEAIESTSRATHRYVRHQETWFRRFNEVNWLGSSSPDLVEQAIKQVSDFLHDQPRETG